MYQLESIQLTNPYSQVLKFYQRAIIHSVISIIDLFSINIDVFLSISWLDQSSNSMMPITSHPFGLKFPTILQHRASYFMEYIIHLELCLHESIPGSVLRFATHIRFTELCFTCSTLPQNYLFRSQSFDRTKKTGFDEVTNENPSWRQFTRTTILFIEFVIYRTVYRNFSLLNFSMRNDFVVQQTRFIVVAWTWFI